MREPTKNKTSISKTLLLGKDSVEEGCGCNIVHSMAMTYHYDIIIKKANTITFSNSMTEQSYEEIIS